MPDANEARERTQKREAEMKAARAEATLQTKEELLERNKKGLETDPRHIEEDSRPPEERVKKAESLQERVDAAEAASPSSESVTNGDLEEAGRDTDEDRNSDFEVEQLADEEERFQESVLDAMREEMVRQGMELLGKLGVLTIQPGDVLVMMEPSHMPDDAIEQTKQHMQRALAYAGARASGVMVLTGGAQLGVLRKDNLEQQSADGQLQNKLQAIVSDVEILMRALQPFADYYTLAEPYMTDEEKVIVATKGVEGEVTLRSKHFWTAKHVFAAMRSLYKVESEPTNESDNG